MLAIALLSATIHAAEEPPAASVDTATLITRGKERLAKNDPKGALPIFEEVLKRDPKNAEVLYYTGNLYLQLGEVRQGIDNLSRSIDLNPANYKLHLVLAKAHEKFASATDAIHEYQEVIRLAPGSPEAKEADKQSRLLSGKVALRNNETKQADEIFAKLTREFPKDSALQTSIQAARQAATLVQKAQDQMGRQDTAGALETAESALSKDPTNARALFLAGYIHVLRNESDQGLKLLASSLDRAPENFRLRLVVAKSYDQFSRLDEAQREYEEVIRSAPDSPEAKEADKLKRIVIGKRDFSLGKADEAQAIFKQLLAEYPSDSSVVGAINLDNQISSQLDEGKAKMANGDLKGALASFESVLKDHPDDVRALYYAGNVALQLLLPDRGLEHLSHAAKLSPDNAALRYLLGKAYQRFGNPNDAIREYAAVIRLASGSPEANDADKQQRLLTGKLALYDGNVQQAQTLFDELTKQYPDDRGMEATIADAKDAARLMGEGQRLLAANDPKGALEKYEAALHKDSNNIKPLFFAGNLHLQLNEPDVGLRYLSIVIALDPTNYRFRLVFAKALYQFGRRGQATEQFQEVIRQAPGTNEAREADKFGRIITGLHYFADGKASQAQEIFDALAKEYPNDVNVTSAVNSANEAVKLVDEGKSLAAKNQPKQALETFQKAAAVAPDNVELLFYIGTLQLQLGQTDEGVKALVRAVDLAPDNYRLRMRAADYFETAGLYGPALEEYQQVTKIAPGTPEALEADLHYRVLLGRRALFDKKPDEAKGIYAELLKTNPANSALLSQIARVYLESQGLKDGLASFDSLVAEVPEDALAHSVLAALYERTNNAAKALEHSEKLLALTLPGPGAEALKLNIARLRGIKALSEQNFAAARDSFNEVLGKVPDDRSSLLNLATAYHGLKDNDKAVEIFNGMIDKNPNDSAARLRLGVIEYIDLKQTEAAAQQFEEIRIRRQNTPESGQAAQFLTQIYSAPGGKEIQDKVQSAVIENIRAHAAGPDDPKMWRQLAVANLAMGRKDAELEALENIARIDPQDAVAQATIGDLYDERNDLDKAEDAYARAIDASQSDQMKTANELKLRMVLGRAALNAHKFTTAEENFKAVVKMNPNNYFAHYFLGIIYNAQRRFPQAAHEYEEVLRVVRNHGVAHFNLGLVYEQMKREEDALAEYRAAARLPMPDPLPDAVKSQIESVQKRINGFTYTLNYSSTYNSNFNQTKTDPFYEFNSSLDGSATYRYKLDHRPVYLGMTLNPSYVTYHRSEFDLYSLSFSPFISVNRYRKDFSASLLHRETSNFALQRFLNTTDTFNGDIVGTFDAMPVSSWLRRGVDLSPGLGTWDLNLSASKFKASGSPIYDANSYTIGGTVNLPYDDRSQVVANYSFTENVNTSDIGNDNAYVSHTMGLQFTRVLGPGWSAYGGYSFILSDYTNRDSATLFKKYRTNQTHVLSSGMNYFLSQDLRVFVAAGFRLNKSNLPTGFILSPEDAATAVGIQSSALGDYTNLSISTGLAFSF